MLRSSSNVPAALTLPLCVLMNTESVKIDLLFDADEYRRTGECPWTFFAYPTSLPTDHGLPLDDDACRYLAAIQSRGIEVAVWGDGVAKNTTYFACRRDDIQRLTDVVNSLETTELFGENFAAIRSEELFTLLENGT
ncbi:MAG: hypothetical protein VYA84_17785 [Planctomycetota bacterium]|nr:hypothetical protein [Planctomycetota bacterium]